MGCTAVGEGCVELPVLASRLISYRITDGSLEATITCRQGYQLQHVNNSSPHQLQTLIARCHGDVWDTKRPQCFGLYSTSCMTFCPIQLFIKQYQ